MILAAQQVQDQEEDDEHYAASTFTFCDMTGLKIKRGLLLMPPSHARVPPKLIGAQEARQSPKIVYNRHPDTIREPERQVATHPFSFPDMLAYSMTSSTRVGGKPAEWFGYPDGDWLVRAG